MVEFAMVVPVVVGVLMGGVEVAWQYVASVALENAALTAARVGSLGRKNADGTRDGSACLSEVKAAAIEASAGLLSSARLTLTPTQYSKASDLAARTGGSAGTGVAGGFVEYRLVYQQPLLFFGRTAVFSGSSVTHEVRAAVMNEPYPNATSKTPCPS